MRTSTTCWHKQPANLKANALLPTGHGAPKWGGGQEVAYTMQACWRLEKREEQLQLYVPVESR